MKVRIEPLAASVIRRLPTPVKGRIKESISELADDPFGHKGLTGVKRLQSDEGTVYRLKVGAWRVAYEVEGDDVRVLHVFPREDGYGWMERFGFL